VEEALAPWREAYAVATADLEPPVVVACSGGPDSVALLAITADAGLDPIAVHVDHGLRPGSHRERDHVAAVAARLGTRFDARAVDVPRGSNLEERARDARYEALEAARAEHDATAVLVGHTADDQAETVLLNILRGAAGTGLSGMPSRRGFVVRPLLGVRRVETSALCAALGLPVLHDPMNDDESFRRVAVRRHVLPVLSDVAGRDLVPVIARQADLLREESGFLDELARAAWPGPDGTSARALTALPSVLARRAVRQWLGPPPPSSAEVTRVLLVASGRHRATELAGGRTVRRASGRLQLDASSQSGM
jgi:tRNA(Ile)-lysidine synthase